MIDAEVRKEALDSGRQCRSEARYGRVYFVQWPVELVFQPPVAGAAQAGGGDAKRPRDLLQDDQIIRDP